MSRHRYFAAIGLIGLTGFISGCASVKEIYSNDGRKAYALSCNGGQGWDSCFATAGDLCKSAGYDILGF